MIPQLWKGTLKKQVTNHLKDIILPENMGFMHTASNGKRATRVSYVSAVQSKKNLTLGAGFSHLNRDFQYPCRHCSIPWAPRGPALYLPALSRFLTYSKEQKVAQRTSLQAIEFGGWRKCLGGLLEKMPGALDSRGRTARAHDKGDVNEAYKECRFFGAGR